VADRLGVGSPPPVARVIFLDRRPRTIGPGTDDAAAGRSSVVAHQGTATRALPGWKGSDKAWGQLVTCVQRLFAPFDVVVTDQPPSSADHVLVVVGGRPKDLGVKDSRVAGLAPFSGGVIPRAVVFAFAATQRHQPQAVCETIGMEVAHAFGLDHAYLCSDVMSYLKPCGKRGFVDRDAPVRRAQAARLRGRRRPDAELPSPPARGVRAAARDRRARGSGPVGDPTQGAEQDVEGDLVVAALGHDQIGPALGRLDVLEVHRPDRGVVLIAHRLRSCGRAARGRGGCGASAGCRRRCRRRP
jgi:hypothetical protein